ncbi:MAG TPA: radical SAM family heme chaperone HemW, partial [Bacteroidota bacterium]
YIHVPFCEHKCIYCDFYSIAPNGNGKADFEGLIPEFLAALKTEITLRGRDPRFASRYDTVFFGGGTPSLLDPSNIAEILALFSETFSLDPQVEVTLETNPGTVDLRKLAGFREAGVNRVSIGIQSFHEDDLKFLTRIHSADQARDCVRNAYGAGINNVSLDLIFSLPGQTPDRWCANLEEAMKLGPTHISCYSLTVEPNTPLSRMVAQKQVTPLPRDEDAELYAFTTEFLERHGYEQYEVSNFCRPGHQSRHNKKYWDHSNYLGFGPSAHSFWNGTRWWNLSNVSGYAQRLRAEVLPTAGEEILTAEQRWEEEVFLGLRSSGIDLVRIRERYDGDVPERVGTMIEGLVKDRLATTADGHFRLTSKGYALCDEICCAFIE